MRFIHFGDCHLGSWRQTELRELNFRSFTEVINRCIKYKADFVLITGDLFDSAYPSIDILREAFAEFRRLKEASIPVFIIAGSHDYSASGKTFIDVLERAGFCKNVGLFEERNEKIVLLPTIYKNVAIYGFPGKKSNMEIEDLRRISIQDSPGMFKILMLHTAITEAIGSLPIKSINLRELPAADYVALSHLHINFYVGNVAYSGPLFPNNLTELEELKCGSFYFFDSGKLIREKISLKEVLVFDLTISNTLSATDEIISLLSDKNLNEKIVILKINGIFKNGKISDIDFSKIEDFVLRKGAYSFLKNTSKLYFSDTDIIFNIEDASNLEAEIIKKYSESNSSKFNELIESLFKVLQSEKHEDERISDYQERFFSECKRILPKCF